MLYNLQHSDAQALVISQVDAVLVLGTLNKDKAAVPDDWRAAVALESARTGSGDLR